MIKVKWQHRMTLVPLKLFGDMGSISKGPDVGRCMFFRELKNAIAAGVKDGAGGADEIVR